MQSSATKSRFYLLGFSSANSQNNRKSNLNSIPRKTRNSLKIRQIEKNPIILKSSTGHLRYVVVGAVSMGFLLFVMGMDEQKAMALGPEGPLMEEFWENVRRYALYALTVSTGALYTIFQPIVELLKNPISAVLIILIFGGSFYIISQVLSAMVGVTDFSYDYGY